MNIRKAERKQAKIKMALQGPSGSGKTYSSLLLARGLVGSLEKVCVVDTENGSSDLYDHLGPFCNIPLTAPFTPEKYLQAIELAEKEGMEVIIIDSLSHAWEYLLDYHSSLSGNSFNNWSKVTPRNNALFTKILSSQAHMISTLRVKQDYVLTDKNGKLVPEKVGLKSVQKDGADYEFTLVFDINVKHKASCNKDRTGLFMDCPEFTIDSSTGDYIRNWCNNANIESRIKSAKSLKELLEIYNYNHDAELVSLFTERKTELLNNAKHLQNGKP